MITCLIQLRKKYDLKMNISTNIEMQIYAYFEKCHLYVPQMSILVCMYKYMLTYNMVDT